jgi:glycosyltransferase involved in cell wall biosynthesis
VPFPLVYIAGTFPARSETFVYREVRALRDAGWDVRTVSLNEPTERGLPDLKDLETGTTYVYGGGASRTLVAYLVESITHPIRSAVTMLGAWRDAIVPHERMSISARLKLLVQAAAGIGVAGRLRKAGGVRHIHCHFAHAPTTVGMYAAGQLGVPFSFTGHANDLFQRRALLMRKLDRAAFVACISEWHRELYLELCPAGGDRFDVIRCGVDVDAWTPKPDAGRDIAAGDPLRILTVCRLVEKKGVDMLIRALALFGEQTKRPWRLTVAGDGPERERLQTLARELGCGDSINWLGPVGNERVRELLSSSCDLFVLACREDRSGDRDGIPVVLMEAMACGVPVVSGDLPAIRELIRSGHSGILLDVNRPEPLAAELASLVSNSDLRRQLATGGRERVEEEFSLRRTIDRLTRRFAVEAGEKGPIKSAVTRPIG